MRNIGDIVIHQKSDTIRPSEHLLDTSDRGEGFSTVDALADLAEIFSTRFTTCIFMNSLISPEILMKRGMMPNFFARYDFMVPEKDHRFNI
jgi:hypothetical protein